MKKWMVILLLLFLCISCGQDKNLETIQEDSLELKYSHIIQVPTPDMIRFLKNRYRLVPDRRFMGAFSYLSQFFSGKKSDIRAIFREGNWLLFRDGKYFGTLPEFPGFADWLLLLKQTATEFHQKKSFKLKARIDHREIEAIKKQLDSFETADIIKALDSLNKLWIKKRHSPDILKLSSRALTLLCLQTLDELDIADQLFSRALAVMAVSEVLTGESLLQEETVLSFLTGYTEYTKEAVRRLDQNDPYRLFILREDKQLKQSAETLEDPRAEYLWLLRFSEHRNQQAWMQEQERLWPHNRFVLPLMKAGLALDKFGMNRSISTILTLAVLDQIYRLNKDSSLKDEIEKISENMKNMGNPDMASVLATFEKYADSFKPQGPFLYPEDLEYFFRSCFYSGLYLLGEHLVFSLGSIPAADEFLQSLGSPAEPFPSEFTGWLSNLVRFKQKKLNADQIIASMKNINLIRGNAVRRSFGAVIDQKMSIWKYSIRAVKHLADKMDSRPAHRIRLYRAAYNYLFDLALFEKIISSLKNHMAIHYPYPQFGFAVYSLDKKKIFEIIDNRRIPARMKMNLLNFLFDRKGIDISDFQMRFQALLDENPDSWPLFSKVADYYKDKDRIKEAKQVISKWVDSHDRSWGFDYINACKKLAKLYLQEKKYREGLKIVEPAAISYQAGSLETKALLLSGLGRKAEAEAIAEAVIKRYPQVWRSRAIVASIYWQHNKFDKAAAILAGYPYEQNSNQWYRELAPRFYSVFKDRSNIEISGAIKALKSARLDSFFIKNITNPFSKNNQLEKAFKIVSGLKGGGMRILFVRIDGYRYLKDWKGKAVALEWLKKNVPPQLLGPAPLIVYESKEYDLLWDWLEESGDITARTTLWLMRATAFVGSGISDEARLAKLKEYYGKPGRLHYHRIGQYLMDMVSEEEILKEMTRPKQKCEITFFVGLKKEASGDLYGASDWYRTCLETGLETNGEYRWAGYTLRNWRNKYMFLRYMDGEK